MRAVTATSLDFPACTDPGVLQPRARRVRDLVCRHADHAAGAVAWAGNSSGARKLNLHSVDINNSSGIVALDTRDPALFVAQQAEASFCFPVIEVNLQRFQYLTFVVEQESGSSLAVTAAQLSVIRTF